MPQIGWLEILAIVIIAILVLGPKEFPIALKKIGSYFGKLKNTLSNFQREVNSVTDNIDIEKDTNNKKELKTETNNILDTKIASKLARSYSDNHSLKTLIKEFVHVDISKQFQSSDFGGELTPAQLKYCANDVIYLHKIHEELNKILIRENRVKLYQDCLKFLKTRVELDLALFKEDIWSH